MPFIAAVTQPGWIATLRAHGFSEEVNFWRPGRQPVAKSHVGNAVLFVQKGKNPRLLAGYGVIDRYELLSISDAWARWRERNGVLSLEEFVEGLTHVAEGTSTNGGGMSNRIEGAKTLIGCVVLRDVLLLPEERLPFVQDVLPGFPNNVVSYKSYAEDLPSPFQTFLKPAVALETGNFLGRTQIEDAEKDAIEDHAMRMCYSLFSNWLVDDVSQPASALEALENPHPGYDIRVRRPPQEFHIEVKGTKLQSPLITITRNELETATSDPWARLLVVSSIRTFQDASGWHGIGGTPVLYRWANTERLKAILNGIKLGKDHGLDLKAPEWTLHVHKTDLLIADQN